jgi:hypothetical protein
LTARTLDLIPKKLNELYEFHEWRNALAILSAAYPEEWSDIISVLSDFRLLRSDIEKSADGEKFGDRSKVVIRLDDLALRPRGWIPREFATAIVVDDVRIVLSSAIRVLQATGFYESEILQLFDQVAKKGERFPVWLQPLSDEQSGSAKDR